MNVGELKEALGVPVDGLDREDPWPVMIWCECLTGGSWHTVKAVRPDDDRMVLVLEPWLR